MTTGPSIARRAIAGALLLITPVATQLVLWPNLADMPWGYLIFGTSQLLGWGLLLTVCLGIGSAHPGSTSSRAGRAGQRIVLAGCVLQMAFGAVYGISTLAMGEPLEASFWLFLLGFLTLVVGGVLWGRVLCRDTRTRLAGNGFLAMAGLGFLAIAVGDNVVHDVTLLAGYVAWVVIGHGAAHGLHAPGERALPRQATTTT